MECMMMCHARQEDRIAGKIRPCPYSSPFAFVRRRVSPAGRRGQKRRAYAHHWIKLCLMTPQSGSESELGSSLVLVVQVKIILVLNTCLEVSFEDKLGRLESFTIDSHKF